MLDKKSKIYVAGHNGLVGSAILKCLKEKGYENFILKTHNELDLTDQDEVEKFFEAEKPDYVILAAAKVGGIAANNALRADFIYENLQIQNNVIYQSYRNGVKKLLFLGSTCIYPKNSPQPMPEDCLLTSPLEYTNEPYAIAKIAGMKMCESFNLQYGTDFISVMPTNLYGPNDNFDLECSHVLPAIIRKVHLAKLMEEGRYDEVLADLKMNSMDEAEQYLKKYGVNGNKVEIWGTGSPRRDFLYSEDMADACVYILENISFADMYDKGAKEIRNTHINIGSGEDISIKELAGMVKSILGFKGELVFNSSRPDGTLLKLTDVKKLNSLGWRYKVGLEEGISRLYRWYMQNDKAVKC